jgi:hypothetical protein
MTNLRIALFSCAALAAVATMPHDAAAATKAKICSTLFQPVCAVAPNGTNQTYSNACVARRAHARILAPGQCQGPICFFIFDPVCARNPKTHRRQTYSNLCAAEVAQATLIHKGACK